ncbi:MAG: N-6 DNA methylase, partial [Pseudonocardiaceae bacterium]
GYQQLEGEIGRIIMILRSLNVRAVTHSGVDFLGTFYEAFLRYGYDNNSLGIVFTPRHITRFCVDLLDVDHNDRVVDLACGTGGFLVSALDRMVATAPREASKNKIRSSLSGYDPNPTVWALAVLNMYFRGDGKSHINRASSLTARARSEVRQRFTKAFLNPPFSQDDEPERQFIDASMAACEPGGRLAVVVKAGIFADGEHKAWRGEFTRRHTVQAVISLPEDLFYPTAAPTSIMIAKAHVPQLESGEVYLARVSNDGFTKLKGKRVERPGGELADIVAAYRKAQAGSAVMDERSVTVPGSTLLGGAEWSPQEWLPQPHVENTAVEHQRVLLAGSILRAVAQYPELAELVMTNLGSDRGSTPLPYGSGLLPLSDLFEVQNGRSSGEKNYLEGDVPYVSSGDLSNSIVGLVHPVPGELFSTGAITVTAFGQAFVQPWPFMARGNGGSSVRVLIPRFRMSFRELLWFASQLNLQRWRFFYARMAIKSRIVRLKVEVPTAAIPDERTGFHASISGFLGSFRLQRRTISGVD